jgi:hypothetical protein
MDLIKEEVPIEKGKVIVYGGVGNPLVVTEYVKVACCTRVGTYLISVRLDKQYSNKSISIISNL